MRIQLRWMAALALVALLAGGCCSPYAYRTCGNGSYPSYSGSGYNYGTTGWSDGTFASGKCVSGKCASYDGDWVCPYN